MEYAYLNFRKTKKKNLGRGGVVEDTMFVTEEQEILLLFKLLAYVLFSFR